MGNWKFAFEIPYNTKKVCTRFLNLQGKGKGQQTSVAKLFNLLDGCTSQ